jgi:hypothetical protein
MPREIDNFRILIILSVATWMCGMYVSYNAAPPAAELISIYEWQGFGEVVPGPLGQRVFWVESALLLGGLLGMFFFSRIARGAVLAAILLNPLRTALGGIWVSSALEDTFWALHWTFFMFTVGMAFFSEPIKEGFGAAQHASKSS